MALLMAGVDGVSKLRDKSGTAQVSLRQLADDFADYIAMRPETAATLDGLARFLSGLHTRQSVPNGQRGHLIRELLPGEADDVAANAPPERWVAVYSHLVDAAEVTGMSMDIHVHLLSRLTFWHMRQADHELAGRPRVPSGAAGP